MLLLALLEAAGIAKLGISLGAGVAAIGAGLPPLSLHLIKGIKASWANGPRGGSYSHAPLAAARQSLNKLGLCTRLAQTFVYPHN